MEVGELNATIPLPQQMKAAFAQELPVPAGTERHLEGALAETLGRTGNFIRAQLAYGIAQSYGSAHEPALQLAIALEYFHTASLLFDDLPSMDDATHRRGALCVHPLYGEGPAILAALALINRGYALLWKTAACSTGDRQAEALGFAEHYLGLGGLLNGQSHDLHYAQLAHAERSPQQVAMGKTVALIRLSLGLPAILGGASRREVQLLNRLAVAWGLAYQAVDDLKDLLHDAEQAGKTTARDSMLDRPNAALFFGAEATVQRLAQLVHLGRRVRGLLQRARPALTSLDAPAGRLEVEVAALAALLPGAQHSGAAL